MGRCTRSAHKIERIERLLVLTRYTQSSGQVFILRASLRRVICIARGLAGVQFAGEMQEIDMRNVFRPRNFLLFLVGLPILLLGGYVVEFAYRKNSCAPGEHVLLSEDEAIKQAKNRISRARYGSHGVPGYVDEKPHAVDFDQTLNCCKAIRTRNIFGVIIWDVYMDGETIGEPKKRKVGVDMRLSNCGAVFHDSFITADPIR